MMEEQAADDWRIALYYCYSSITDIEEHIFFQREWCVSRELSGRVRVSHEGINGVLSGKVASLREYEKELKKELLRIRLTRQENSKAAEDSSEECRLDLDIKYCQLRPDLSVKEQLFNSLSVKATREVVSLYEPTPDQICTQGVPINSKRYYRRRRRNRKKPERSLVVDDGGDDGDACTANQSSYDKPNDAQTQTILDLKSYSPAPHLSPQEWNKQLLSLLSNKQDVILLDARNVYESRVGHFAVNGVPTLLTNTRKYSSLPSVMESHAKHLAGKHVFMYCTGGVRCERASVCLQAMADNKDKWKDHPKPKGIYQLHGGIQKYLEQYGTSMNISMDTATIEKQQHSCEQQGRLPDICLYKGKNFVFDPRRTDCFVGRPGEGPAGHCLVCQNSHDDYDNGHAPCNNREARCCRCRVLVLVCDECRQTAVRCWGEDEAEEDHKTNIYCGGSECIDQGNAVQQVEIIIPNGKPTEE